MAKKRKKQTARKRKKQNLAGLDFQALMDLRNQVDEALTGYRSTLERQLEALGSSVASLGGKVARGMRGSKLKGMKVAREISWSRRRDLGWTRRNAKLVGCGNQRRQKAGRFFNR